MIHITQQAQQYIAAKGGVATIWFESCYSGGG